jgi:hypothetical protein
MTNKVILHAELPHQQWVIKDAGFPGVQGNSLKSIKSQVPDSKKKYKSYQTVAG